MYLSMLDNEKRHLFLDLELYISKIDGDFSEQEKRVIDAHCIEMHIDSNNYESETSFDELLAKIKETFSKQEKRIVFLELLATVLADDLYHEAEEEMVGKLSSILDVSSDDTDKAFAIVRDMKAVYERCADFIK